MTVAALFVEKGGVYYEPGLDVDPWDEERDARRYAGPWPVVAHPPCAAWCQLAGLREHRYGYRKGEDGGCFAAALASVRAHGGILEHPAYSAAWGRYGLPTPTRDAWTIDFVDKGWVTEVSQRAYGHRARKRTWLYFVGTSPPRMDWSEPAPLAYVSGSHNHTSMPLGTARVWSREAKRTPPAFRDLLLSIARSARPNDGRETARKDT